MSLSKIWGGAAALGFAGLALSGPAAAVTVGTGAMAAKSEAAGAVETVDLRTYRHCHWRDGVRYCHGPHVLVTPGLNLYFGPGIRLHHHHHHHHHHH